MGDFTGLVAVVMIFCIPMFAIWTGHRQKVLELQLRLRSEGNAETQAAIRGLREELQALRETSMQYDISFDTALQRIERRVVILESRSQDSEQRATVELRPNMVPDEHATVELRTGH